MASHFARIIAITAATTMLIAACAPGAPSSNTASPRATAAPVAATTAHPAVTFPGATPKQILLRNDMRRLWEDHIIWTRLFIVSFAAGLPDTDATAGRLLRNQDDIGGAVATYYGAAAGAKLTDLLKEHIVVAVNVLRAAKAGNAADFDTANAKWYANMDEISGFLSSANPEHWPLASVKPLMRVHLDLTLEEASARLKGDRQADITAYDKIHAHILEMADTLTNGIVKHFPERFR